MVYRLTVGYRGTEYAGWQRQANALAVQEVVEEALAEVLGERVVVHGAGRTDAGVHARGQVAHFESGREFPRSGLVHAANRLLPLDVRLTEAARMPEGFHARKHAASKVYRYSMVRARILQPVDALFAIRVQPEIDFESMRRAAEALVGSHDFTAFALAGGSHKSAERTLFGVELEEHGERLTLAVEGDGFLRGMMRSLVGTLLEVGGGRRSAEDFRRLLAGRPRGEAGPTAPPQGLELSRVMYPPDWQPLAD